MRKKSKLLTTSLRRAKSKRKKSATEERLRSQRKILASLEKTSQYLAIETDVKTILESIAKTMGRALGAKYVNFWAFTPDRKGLYITAAYGMQKQYIEHSKRSPIPVGSAWIGRAVESGQAWATRNIDKDPRLLKEIKSWATPVKKQDYHGLLCIPMMRKKEIMGGMCIYYKDIHDFEYFEMSLATIVANQAATAVENAQIFQELISEKQKTGSMVKSLYDGLIVQDNDKTINAFNPRAEELLWVRADEVLNKKPSQLSLKENKLYANIQKICAMGLLDFESREIIISEPSRRVFEITLVPLKDEKNRRTGSMRVLHDITHDKEVEQLKTQFVTIASHQLRTPLSGLKWSFNTLLDEDLGSLTKEQRELIIKSGRANDNLIMLVNDLLDVSRLEEGRFEFKFTQVDIHKLIMGMIDSFKPNIESGKLKVVIEKPVGPSPTIRVDKEKIKMAFQNLIDNAIKYTLPGGLVRIKLRIQKVSIILAVQDTGIGINEHDKKFIFTKFFRARNAIRLQTSGSGLGLFIAKEIVKHHNGRIWFDSEENKGSTFYVQLPIKQLSENSKIFARGPASFSLGEAGGSAYG